MCRYVLVTELFPIFQMGLIIEIHHVEVTGHHE